MHLLLTTFFLCRPGPTVICPDAKCARPTLRTTSVFLRFTHACFCTTKICPGVRRSCFSLPWQFLRVLFFRMKLCVMQRHTTRGREKPPSCQRRENTQNLQTCWTRQHNVCPQAPSLPCSTKPPSPRMALASATLSSPTHPHTHTRPLRTLHTKLTTHHPTDPHPITPIPPPHPALLPPFHATHASKTTHTPTCTTKRRECLNLL